MHKRIALCLALCHTRIEWSSEWFSGGEPLHGAKHIAHVKLHRVLTAANQKVSKPPSIVAWQGHERSKSVPHTAESTCDMCVGGVPLNPSQPLWRQHGCCGRKSGALPATIRNKKPSLSTAGTANTLKRRRESHCA
jgi:hypothetical protein